MVRAANRYKQVRLTFTEERTCLSWSLMVKPLNVEWHYKQTIARGTSEKPTPSIETLEEAILALVVILEEQVLPGVTQA